MFRDVSSYVNFICENKLSQAQFLFLYLLEFRKFDEINTYKKAFPSEDGSMIGEHSKQDLINRGFIEKTGEGTTANDYYVTDKFKRLFLKNHFAAFDEVIAAYPGYAKMNGQSYPLHNIDKYKGAILYRERIGNSIDEHRRVLEDIEYGRNNGLLTSGLDKFLTGELWNQIRKVREGQQNSIVTANSGMNDYSF